MAGKGGGAWKVAYADFVTAMMAFFLVMWIVAQGKPVTQAVAHYFNEPFQTKAQGPDSRAGEPEAPTPPAPAAAAGVDLKIPAIGLPASKPPAPVAAPRREPEAPPKETSGRMKAPKVDSLALHDGKRHVRGAMIRFAEDSAELTRDAKEELDRLVPDLRGKRNKIELRGHATRRPSASGTSKDAWQLSYDRGLAAMKYLEQQGIEPERFRLSQAGIHEPLTIGEVPLALNARVEIYVLTEFVEDLVGTRKERAQRVATP
jgi:chemotaxis protein MotB